MAIIKKNQLVPKLPENRISKPVHNLPHSKKQLKNSLKYETILRNILPLIGKDEVKIIFAQVLLALKLEGVVGRELGDKEVRMIEVIKDGIVQSEEQKQAALGLAKRLLK